LLGLQESLVWLLDKINKSRLRARIKIKVIENILLSFVSGMQWLECNRSAESSEAFSYEL
jgi:hypothetical protein